MFVHVTYFIFIGILVVFLKQCLAFVRKFPKYKCILGLVWPIVCFFCVMKHVPCDVIFVATILELVFICGKFSFAFSSPEPYWFCLVFLYSNALRVVGTIFHHFLNLLLAINVILQSLGRHIRWRIQQLGHFQFFLNWSGLYSPNFSHRFLLKLTKIERKVDNLFFRLPPGQPYWISCRHIGQIWTFMRLPDALHTISC